MRLRYLTAGESHGPALVAILEGIPSGVSLTEEVIDLELTRRQHGYGAGGRMKIEKDKVRILSGVLEKTTTGAPIAILVENLDHAKWKGKQIEPFTIPRPGHVDLIAAIKFGYLDLRPGLERASARETASRVAVGAICKTYLKQFNITVEGYVTAIADIEADLSEIPLTQRFDLSEKSDVRCPNLETAEAMRYRIKEAIAEKDSLGGIIEIIVMNVPAGLGSFVQWDRRLDARLGRAVLSVQAIKGVEIGAAFENCRLPGSQVQDDIYLDQDRLVRKTNYCGGLEGGVTTGQPMIVRAAMKPIATTIKPHNSVDLVTGLPIKTRHERSDFCPVPRAVPVLEAVTAFEIAESLMEKLGGDSLEEQTLRFKALKSATLSDLHLDGKEHRFWEE
jgi:chorismate synthase